MEKNTPLPILKILMESLHFFMKIEILFIFSIDDIVSRELGVEFPIVVNLS